MHARLPSRNVRENAWNAGIPPLFLTCIEAGFPSPAEDWIEDRLELNRLLVKAPSTTFFLRVKGDSMIRAGILEGDILFVDRSIRPAHNHIVIAVLNGKLTVKRLHREAGTVRLVADNPRYDAIPIGPVQDFREMRTPRCTTRWNELPVAWAR